MKRYRNKDNGTIAEVIHQDVTTTLRLDDSTELIVTPYTLRNEWSELLTFSEFSSQMMEWNVDHNQEEARKSGVIVISQDSFKKEYSIESRSYRAWNNNRAFQHDKIASSIFGSSLDGSDIYVRLDWYIHKGWKVDYCYME